MTKILIRDAGEIKVSSERIRKEFNKEKLQRLAASYMKMGQLEPGICTKDENGEFCLVAGERRLRACKIAQVPFEFVLREDADPELLLEIELEENLNRENLTWQEEVDGLDRLHRLRQTQAERKGDHQSLDDTSVETERSRASVHRDLELAEWAREFQEIKDAPSKQEAYKIIKRYKAELLRNQLLQQAVDEGRAGLTEEDKAAIAERDGTEVAEEGEVLNVGGIVIPSAVLLDYDKRLIQGRMEEEIERFEDGSVNLVLFDPPWGVNVTEVQEKSGQSESFDDGEEVFTEGLEGWLRVLFSKMSEGSHLYMFFPIKSHQLVYDTLERAGFQVNRMPIIWHKQGSHATRNPEIWPGRSYEPIAFARKGQRKLIVQGAPDVIITMAPTSAMKAGHPTAKHPDIYIEILKRSAYPGDKVLDPMCGSGMFAVACEVYQVAKKLNWWGIEEKRAFRELALENVIKGYSKIINREPIEKEYVSHSNPDPLPEDFKELEPGTDRWKKYWDAHPEKQEEMLTWRKEKE